MSNEGQRVLHITESHSKKDGGVTTVVNDLTYHLHTIGVFSCVVAATDIEEPTPEGVSFVCMGLSCNRVSSLFSSDLKGRLKRLVQEKSIDVIHIHGIWMPLQIVSARLAKEMNIPFVVTSHGMLEPWLWSGKGWLGLIKKKLYFNFIVHPAYRQDARIHAITPREAKNLKALFPTNKQETIPNAIDLAVNDKLDFIPTSKAIFFIGRINPKKGVGLLLESFHNANVSSDWRLIIAGPEEVPEYFEELCSFVQEHDLESKVTFIGPVYGEEKERLYKSSWVTVVPSYSEVVGMVNLEASSFHCPSITTTTTGLWDWQEGGGILIEPEEKALTAALKSCVQWSGRERKERGKASFKLVQEKYAWHVVGKQWVHLYDDLTREERSDE
jgi:glycosyltransferase involved in cell wall biosynthesis